MIEPLTPAADTGGLLAGPLPETGPEQLEGHRRRLGPCPPGDAELIPVLQRSGLRGRGGASFPAGRKWRTVAERSRDDAVVLVNAMEADPTSLKDRQLMTTRPHLVLDGGLLAAQAVGATDIVLAVNRSFKESWAALAQAIAEADVKRWRLPGSGRRVQISLAAVPNRYVAGEETALVHFLNGGEVRPLLKPPHPFERGIRRRPTLVNNVETLAWTALIARHGDAWYRALAPGGGLPVLVTVGGSVQRPGVLQTRSASTIGEVLEMAGGPSAPLSAVLVGGYFGRWLPAETAEGMQLDGLTGDPGLGAATGIVVALPQSACGLTETARMLSFLAGESAGQCGPCLHGLPAMAQVTARIASGKGRAPDLDRLRRWAAQLATGRGACHHPDGAVALLQSSLRTFADDLATHLQRGACRASQAGPVVTMVRTDPGWQ
jgi:NADH:ubiquinone oxidoreductase subunit F (NADH-binding)